MELFPVNIATGKAFCNRVEERHRLKEYIKNSRHVVIIAARRCGKTSLVNQVLLELHLPYTIMELTMAVSNDDIEHIIIKHISDLLNSILPKTIKAKQKILKLFQWLNPELVLTVGGQKIIFHPEQSKSNSIENISEILKKLDNAAMLSKKKSGCRYG